MELRIAQLAFDRILQDTEEKVLGNPMGDGHESLLRSFFQRDIAPLIHQTAHLTHGQQLEIAEQVRIILRNHCWINLDDPRWQAMIPRMIKHLNDVAGSQDPAVLYLDPKGGIPDWAPPPPGNCRQGPSVACTMPDCTERINVPEFHLEFVHGIDTPKNRYVVRPAHIMKMGRGIMVQHLVQDAGELNSFRAEKKEVELQLERLDPSYRSRHRLPVHEREETNPNSSLFPSTAPFKETLTNMLIDLREAGKTKGLLRSRNEWGTYSEVLAELKEILARAMEVNGGLV